MKRQVIYSIDNIKKEAKTLVNKGLLSRQQTIYSMCKFIPAKEWNSFETELELHEYLLRDHIIDLLQPEIWENNQF